MANRAPFAVGEWYHCYSRGVDKRDVFGNEHDAERFLMLLYLANGERAVDLHNVEKPDFKKIVAGAPEKTGQRIVSIGGYCLMPNHYHVLLGEVVEGGLSEFMRKVGIAYTLYFNAKNDRVGNLFVRPFRSRHITSDRYFQKVLQYIHMNPAELFEADWKSGRVGNLASLQSKLIDYRYCSLRAHANRTADPILSPEVFEMAQQVSVRQMLEEARAYYAELADERFLR